VREAEQRAGDPLADNCGRHVGVAGGDGWHDRCVGYVQTLDPVHPAFGVDDRMRIGGRPHLAGPRRMVGPLRRGRHRLHRNSFAQAATRRVLEPLGMADSWFPERAPVSPTPSSTPQTAAAESGAEANVHLPNFLIVAARAI
jgi:hypothetical protein